PRRFRPERGQRVVEEPGEPGILREALPERQHVADTEKVLAPERDRIEPEPPRSPLPGHLRGGERLGAPPTPAGAHGARVGGERGGGDWMVTWAQRPAPPAWSVPRERTTGVSVTYAPPSISIAM